MDDQMIFKRYEIKYILTREQMTAVQKDMAEHMTEDVHGHSTIRSLYFDTPDFLLARRSLEHPVYKEKLRLRGYGSVQDDTEVFVELKKKYHSVVYKRRVGMSAIQAKAYLNQGISHMDTQITREIDYALELYSGIRPALLLSYERDAFYDKNNHEFRITFDRNILWRDCDLDLCGNVYGEALLPEDRILMEVKTADAMPLWFVHSLSRNHIYRASFSKYGTTYATLYQNLRHKESAQVSLAG